MKRPQTPDTSPKTVCCWAQVVKTLLLELNPDSTAEHRVASPSEFVTPGCVAGFQLVRRRRQGQDGRPRLFRGFGFVF